MTPECPGVMDESKTGPFVPKHQYDNVVKQRGEAFDRARRAEALYSEQSAKCQVMERFLRRAYEYLESDYRGAEDVDFSDGTLNEIRTFLGEG